jgi:Aerotolerance regulator N-terminal
VSFLFPTLLTIGLPLVVVPVLIHLINLRRQKKIRWAAMQFLVESQRKNKRWILFKQWLLLAARMAAIAVLVLLLAHVVVRNEWLRLLGSGTTHHVVLVDDSYSTGDRWENTTALGEAKRAVEAIVDQAHRQSDSQLVTLLRFSEAARLTAGGQPEIFAQPIDDNFRSKLAAVLAGWEPSQTDVGPADALKAIPRLPLAGEDQTVILYLVSDFRTRQFASATDVRKQLDDLKHQVAQIHLVRCVSQERPNLAITALEPESGVRAAGVETWMNVTIANYGATPASGVLVQLEQDGDALPSLSLDEIPAGKEVTKKFRVQFPGIGAHWLSAALEPDAVEVDNHRYFACQLPAARPVLIIDGSPDGRGGRQLSLALDPGGNTHTGWNPHVEPASYLARTENLGDQAAIVLMDVATLQDDELAALEKYVEAGGGLAWFVGSQTNRSFYDTRLYHDGKGLFPVPLALPTQLLDSRHEATPDLVVSDHTLFRAFAGRRNSFLPLVAIDYYYALAQDWAPPADGSVNVLARLRNDAPLVVEKRFGKGRIVAQLTRLSPGDTPLGRWTNWSLNPIFPVLANELVAYLSAGQRNDAIQQVGENLAVRVPQAKYDPAFRFFLPRDGNKRAEVPIDATADHGQLTAQLDNVPASGIYEVQLQPLEGPPERRAVAFNVPAGEGDLHIVSRDELRGQLAGVDFQLHDAREMSIDQQQLAGMQLGDALLATLIGVLLIEQVLAYIASFHAPVAAGVKR